MARKKKNSGLGVRYICDARPDDVMKIDCFHVPWRVCWLSAMSLVFIFFDEEFCLYFLLTRATRKWLELDGSGIGYNINVDSCVCPVFWTGMCFYNVVLIISLSLCWSGMFSTTVYYYTTIRTLCALSYYSLSVWG